MTGTAKLTGPPEADAAGPMSERDAPRRNDEMDELTAVRQLLAERPAPSPATVAAARASLERAGLPGTQAGCHCT